MQQPAQLQITLDRSSDGSYAVGLEFVDPDLENQDGLKRASGQVHIDRKALAKHRVNDPKQQDDYGRELFRQVFAADELKSLYQGAMDTSQRAGRSVRIRLIIGASSPDLHGIYWELLRDPRTDERLTLSQSTPFSRFMLSQDWTPIKLRRKSELKALVAVAAPDDLHEACGLAEVDAEREIETADKGLLKEGDSSAPITLSYAGRDRSDPLTLQSLLDHLSEGVDILYLICHGWINQREEATIVLETSDKKASPQPIGDFVAGVKRLALDGKAPRLVVLASCESFKEDDVTPESLVSLAPQLAEAGVPAVVAMQGKIQMDTVAGMMPKFFSELMSHGNIEHAMAAARAVFRDGLGKAELARQNWMPVLYSRLRSGMIWYEPGFAKRGELESWPVIVDNVRNGKFVPIIGSGVNELAFGDSRELAGRLAQEYKFPLAPHQRDDLPQVTQFVSVNNTAAFAAKSVYRGFVGEVVRRHGPKNNGSATAEPAAIRSALQAAVDWNPPGNVLNPYQVLANLPAKIYVTATPDTLLERALVGAGKKPEPLICEWKRKRSREDESLGEIPADLRTGAAAVASAGTNGGADADRHRGGPVQPLYEGTPGTSNPVIYQMLGTFANRDSLVLTEDDYFDYLLATARYDLVPDVVSSALVSSTLLFLGFQLNDWSFRVLLRLILSYEGSGGRRAAERKNVGVQINPEEQTFEDVERAGRYFEKYFGTNANLDIYWGRAEDFLTELKAKLDEQPASSIADMDGEDDDWEVQI